AELRAELEAQGSIFQTSSDTEVIVHLMAKARSIQSRADVIGALVAALRRVRGAYSLVLLANDGRMIGVRDPNGFRPLVLGLLKDSYVLSSETCSFDLIEADFVRDIEPGEIVVIEGRSIASHRLPEQAPTTFCVFEHVYFARPDSLVNGRAVYRAREKMGQRLAQESPIPPAPDGSAGAD